MIKNQIQNANSGAKMGEIHAKHTTTGEIQQKRAINSQCTQIFTIQNAILLNFTKDKA